MLQKPSSVTNLSAKRPRLEVVKAPTDKNIQALTGATITSRAVTKGIREAVEVVAEYAASQKE